jgi:hypothetical protein
MVNSTHFTKNDYLAALEAEQKATAVGLKLQAHPTSNTRASLYARQESTKPRLEDIRPDKKDILAPTDAVFVVENIDLRWMVALGQTWDIAPSFFVHHTSRPTGYRPWHDILGTSHTEMIVPGLTEEISAFTKHPFWNEAYSWYVDGVLAHAQATQRTRSIEEDTKRLPQGTTMVDGNASLGSTRISCWTCRDLRRSVREYQPCFIPDFPCS